MGLITAEEAHKDGRMGYGGRRRGNVKTERNAWKSLMDSASVAPREERATQQRVKMPPNHSMKIPDRLDLLGSDPSKMCFLTKHLKSVQQKTVHSMMRRKIYLNNLN